MKRFENAMESLEQALHSPPRFQQSWRHIVRQRADEVAAVLTCESPVAVDSWLAARVSRLERERNRLLARLTVLARLLGEGSDPESVRERFHRLVLDIRHHHQRLNDLAYDALALDVGGSE
jgi:hypothetical protein